MSNAMSLFNSNETMTMSTLEIAELTGKEHKHVMRDVRKLLKELEIPEVQLWATAFYTVNNSQRTREVSTYHVGNVIFS